MSKFPIRQKWKILNFKIFHFCLIGNLGKCCLLDGIHCTVIFIGQKSASIKANDIKGYLYIWCNQRHVTPEFDYKEDGNRHKKAFVCTLTIGGLDFICEADSKSKKDAQTAAAWKFCDKLADLGYMDRNDFPRKEQVATNDAVFLIGSKLL